MKYLQIRGLQRGGEEEAEGAFLCRLESLPRFPALCSGCPSAREARARYK